MIDRNELRALVREVVREAVASLKIPTTPVVPSLLASTPATLADQLGLEPSGPRAVEGKNRIETVRLTKDADLDVFVRKLLRLFDSPKTRVDLKAGRLSFRLAGSAAPAGAFLEVEVDGTGSRLIAFDVLGTGVGEHVLVAQGSVASGWFTGTPPPVDALIIGSIDNAPNK